MFALFAYDLELEDYAGAIDKGERYLAALADYRAGRIDYTALIFGSFCMALQSREEEARSILANAYFQENQPEKAREMLLSIDRAQIRPETVRSYIGILMNLHGLGGEDYSPILADFWEKTDRPEPCEERGRDCGRIMIESAQAAFSPASWAAEDQRGCRRHAWTLFLPLAGKCEVGNAAKILAAQTPEDLTDALSAVEDWTALPVSALVHAVENGVVFPLPERPLNLEIMDNLAARLAGDPAQLAALLDRAAAGTDTPQAIAWAARLALAAVQTCKWEDEAQGMELARTFGSLEGKFLPLCYAVDAPLFTLPPLHRFGNFCARAFTALDGGDAADYARCLRQGLETCPSMKPMAEFLLDHTPQLQAPPVDPELLALAERVRTLLASFPPEDPSVAALKASPSYQRVAHLIEGGGE